jgi:hypothetical protein
MRDRTGAKAQAAGHPLFWWYFVALVVSVGIYTFDKIGFESFAFTFGIIGVAALTINYIRIIEWREHIQRGDNE